MPLLNLQKITEKRDLWSLGVFKFGSLENLFEGGEYTLVKQIREMGLRLNKSYQAVAADPFLFAHGERLYLFYEVKTDHGHGEIHAQSMTSDGQWHAHGVVLKEQFHLSYPQVFLIDGHIYMLPEAAQSGKVILYEANEFPKKWRPCAVLIDEPMRDPTLVESANDGFFLLASTAQYELKLYHAEHLTQPFKDLGIVITNDKRVARCAGSIIRLNGQMLRPAQDCSESYGKKISFQSIECLSRSVYSERPSGLKLQVPPQAWMSRGSHHISCEKFAGNMYVAIDGHNADWRINSLSLGLLRMLEKAVNR